MKAAKDEPVTEPGKEPEPRALRDNEDTSGGVLAQENEKKTEEKQSPQVSIPDLQKAIKKQKEICDVVIQQEHKLRDACSMKDLRKDVEETGLLMKRTEDRVKTLTQTYREEMERVHEQEIKYLLSDDMSKWEDLKELRDKERVHEQEIKYLLSDDMIKWEDLKELRDKEVSLPDLQKALNKQQELCDVFIQDKKKRINKHQQELKLRDDYSVKDVEDRVKTLSQTYREEIEQMERVHDQEIKSLILEEIIKWEEDLKELRDKECKRFPERLNNMDLSFYLDKAFDPEQRAKELDQIRCASVLERLRDCGIKDEKREDH